MKVTNNAADSTTPTPKYPYQSPKPTDGGSITAGTPRTAPSVRISIKVKKA